MRSWLIFLALVLLAAAPEAQLAVSLPSHLHREGNLIVAPHSLADVLTMAGLGAAGRTRSEFEHLLGKLDGKAARERNQQLPLVSANRVWLQKGFPIQPAYARYCQDYFGATPAEIDFRSRPAEAVQAINAWVCKQTGDRIPKLIDTVDAETRLVLTNATTLKATWLHPFDPRATRPRPFTAADGSVSEVPMMACTATYPFFEEPGLQVVEMPYAQAGLSLIVALPSQGTLPALEKALDPSTFQGWLDRLGKPLGEDSPDVELVFPKREVRSEPLKLKGPLQALGLRLAFANGSDFSGLSPRGDQIYIDEVMQATMIRFDELGTEAAGSGGVAMSYRSSPGARIHVDHPFLFFLVHRPTGAVLFSGRVAQP